MISCLSLFVAEINSTRQTLGIGLTGETSFSSLYLTIYDEVACESVKLLISSQVNKIALLFVNFLGSL